MGKRGTKEKHCQSLDESLPLNPKFSLNGGMIYGNSEIRVLGSFIDKEAENRSNQSKFQELWVWVGVSE